MLVPLLISFVVMPLPLRGCPVSIKDHRRTKVGVPKQKEKHFTDTSAAVAVAPEAVAYINGVVTPR